MKYLLPSPLGKLPRTPVPAVSNCDVATIEGKYPLQKIHNSFAVAQARAIRFVLDSTTAEGTLIRMYPLLLIHLLAMVYQYMGQIAPPEKDPSEPHKFAFGN